MSATEEAIERASSLKILPECWGGVQYYEQHFCPYGVDELLGETLTEVGSKVVKIALD